MSRAKKPAPVLMVDLEDKGQDFTVWYVQGGRVIDCEPCQQRVWVNTKVCAAPKAGQPLRIFTVHSREYTTLNYLPVEVRELDEEQAAAVRARYRDFMKELLSE
ncbi:hypothetical protein PQA73_gp60 [Erwinia phage Pavtok]|uniref:Uncharacterized protein n=1 Tax=Erwinia phage Pavtok TaxID=2267655 RepID=A0A345BM17_9CAUD|nr:hypothetical protein PQA73_gp60 [Erwinia phage Pavtok]AXF51488.1 hypothetical protein PAVTOK_60 [Erwinia phage Pavtok]